MESAKEIDKHQEMILKFDWEFEPSEKDKLRVDENGSLQVEDNFEGDASHHIEGQIAYLTNSKRDLSKWVSTISITNKSLGWKRYLGLIYTLLSTNMFSLSSNILKMLGHIHPLNLGTFAFPMGALCTAPFIYYTVKFEKKSVTKNLLPLNKHKMVAFLIWFRATISVLISFGLIASFHYISVADTRTIVASSVITVNLFGCILLGEKCGVVPLIVAIMALLGIGVMTRPPILTGADDFDKETLIGVAFAFGCMTLATAAILLLRFLQNIHHGVQNTFLYVWAFVLTLAIGLSMGKVEIPESHWDLLGIFSVGVMWALGNTFLVLALQVEEAGVVALIRTSEVIFTFGWQMIIVGVYPDLISFVGAFLVVTGVIVVTLRKWVASMDKDSRLGKRLGFLLF